MEGVNTLFRARVSVLVRSDDKRGRSEPVGMFYRRHVCSGKRGAMKSAMGVRGMLEEVLSARFVQETPKRLGGDKAYGSDPLNDRPAPKELQEAADAGRLQGTSSEAPLESGTV
jgi:hypothetical protein